MEKNLIDEGNNKTAIQNFCNTVQCSERGNCLDIIAKICYVNADSHEVLYKSPNEIPIQIFHETNRTIIKIDALLGNPICHPEFSTSFQTMSFVDGLLIIEGTAYKTYPVYRLYIM